jgi:hypothetical protein
MIYAVSFKHKIPEGAMRIDVTSRSGSSGKFFSPFNLGPVDLYDGYVSKNIENGYQYTKIFAQYAGYDDKPSESYWEWAQNGWNNSKPTKYPFGAWTKHLYHWWDGKKLSGLEAQNQIFIPLYKQAVIETLVYKKLKELYQTSKQDIYLVDFEGYNHRYLELTWDQVLNDPDKPVGQAFTLCMLLEGYL